MYEGFPYSAGASKLGGLVESMVKQIKKILMSSVRNNILNYDDFEFLIYETKMLVNKRPIALKNSITSSSFNEDTISPLTPELIVKGYGVPCINIIPQLSQDSGADWLSADENLDSYNKIFYTAMIGFLMTMLSILYPTSAVSR